MNSKPIILLLLSLTTVAFSAPAATEPNDILPQPRFEMSTEARDWLVRVRTDEDWNIYRDPGTIRPKYMAQIIVHRDIGVRSNYLKASMTKAPFAQQLSQAQKDFSAEGFGLWINREATEIPNYYPINLYAVSEEDAKTMAWALLDSFAARAREHRVAHVRELDESKKNLEERQVELAEDEKQFREIEPQYNQYKQNVHPHLRDDKAEELAKETIIQMDTQGNTLDIELAGIRAKLEVIADYLSRADLANHIVERLEGLRIDQMIELSSIEARRETIEKIVSVEKEFCRLYWEHRKLQQRVPSLRSAIERDRERIKEMTATLEHPSVYMKPPQIFTNKVVIYPITTKD